MLPWQGSAMVTIFAGVPEFPVLVHGLHASLLLQKKRSVYKNPGLRNLILLGS
jgi:hypothetical protein